MRSRAGHLACLLLLLSSLAVSNARAGVVESNRTPGGIFIHNLLLRAAVEDAEPALSDYEREESAIAADRAASTPIVALAMPKAVTHTAHVHAVTGSSL